MSCLSDRIIAESFPWKTSDAVRAMAALASADGILSIIFRVFYCWCLNSGKPGFDKHTYFALAETKVIRPSPYESIFLHQNYFTPAQEILLLQHIEDTYDPDELLILQRNVLIHLCFELAPRPSQIYALDAVDLSITSLPAISDIQPANTEFFSLSLTMGKKQSAGMPEKRPRRISKLLAQKFEELIALNDLLFGGSSRAMFINSRGKRVPATRIGKMICEEMESLANSPGGTTLLRHHLGQGMADQGAPADVIAEALGHNSTVAARAYVAATPAIAKIKSRALGRNKTYKKIMDMMLTGKITEKSSVPEERWVRGIVHLQYIHGIGGCDLPAHTQCPKNPVYSCYTCRDFHPFSDGPHSDVRIALEQQAQTFIKAAADHMELERSRVPVQLEVTLEAVDAVIQRCGAIGGEDEHEEN
jgi:integrase